MSVILVIRPDGQTLAWSTPDAFASARHFCGGSIDRLAEAFHELETFEVWHLDDWHGQPVNEAAGAVIGLPTSCAPLRGPVVLTPLPAGHSSRAERAHQRRFFGVLDAVECGFCTADEAGIGVLIRMEGDAA